ncbi:MAG: indolepyruvate ferredoxin oxidoreductase subunit alpha [Desulfobulbaceae bacterium]|nr:indolepyruvate ferredoxin oxidoreductase subunit alpha [Desulfobulbaceae bacterium]
MKKILSGNEAVALGAFENGIKVASAYPGTPSTEILENFARYEGVYAEWAPNEKVAMEVAVGASMTGVRALTTMKHVGLNVAADPFMTLSYTGVSGGLVIVCADDPGMHSSQNEQDNRFYAKFAQVPMLEPSDSQEAKDMMATALELAEAYDTPTLLRLTTRVSHSKGVVECDGAIPKKVVAKGFERDLQKFVMIPGHAKMRHPKVLERVQQLTQVAEETPWNKIDWGDKSVGVVTSGIAYHYVKEILPDASVLKLGQTYPLPAGKIKEFAAEVDQLFVVEELEPYLEEQIRLMGLDVAGKQYFSNLDELTPEIVANGFYEAGVLSSMPALPELSNNGMNMPRPPLMCAGCSHRGLFYALKKLKGIVHGDIGCYTLSVLPPIQAIETCLCMGASISMAHGTAKAMEHGDIEDKRPVFAAIGDSTFFHTGINSLIDVVYNNSNVNIIILDNRITAMTGAQQNPGTGKTLQNQATQAIDIFELVKAMGVKHVREVNPFDIEATTAILKEEATFDGPSVLITREPCVQLTRNQTKESYQVNADICNGCNVCLKLGCPAISLGAEIKSPSGKKMRRQSVIDPMLCTGCTLCDQVCKEDAITRIQ